MIMLMFMQSEKNYKFLRLSGFKVNNQNEVDYVLFSNVKYPQHNYAKLRRFALLKEIKKSQDGIMYIKRSRNFEQPQNGAM